ncbi:hypothetical protein JAAARDRAFT_55193 [Jaapia argillacea MUCL 33604]|uniref:Protein kinase domain-containing protein n=1 Tax=Jaapia argillacea MUCL 33604 TaxID=933084 RepID=A0A067Q6X4_9AGAM|nr:hypothetical protein JAAARDRAFT_55193 [Jaapia argillacea MUCL 33604]
MGLRRTLGTMVFWKPKHQTLNTESSLVEVSQKGTFLTDSLRNHWRTYEGADLIYDIISEYDEPNKLGGLIPLDVLVPRSGSPDSLFDPPTTSSLPRNQPQYPHPPDTSHSTPSPSPPISLTSFQAIRLLGQGGSGTVFLVIHPPTNTSFALKVQQKHIQKNIWVRGEQEVLRRLVGVPGMVQLEASFQDEQNFYLLTPHYSGGSLASELKRCSQIPPSRARFLIAQLVLALELLHQNRVIHRDIKPANILFNHSGHLVLADFGLAVAFDEDEEPFIRSDAGTWAFMAPEMLNGEEYSYEVDFWAVGVLLYVLLTGRVPFGVGKKSMEEFKTRIGNDPLEFDFMDGVDRVTKDFLQKVLTKNPSTRLKSIDSIKTHPYFTSIKWNVLSYNIKNIFQSCHDISSITKYKTYFSRTKEAQRWLRELAGNPLNPSDDPFPDFNYISPTFNWGASGPQQGWSSPPGGSTLDETKSQMKHKRGFFGLRDKRVRETAPI